MRRQLFICYPPCTHYYPSRHPFPDSRLTRTSPDDASADGGKGGGETKEEKGAEGDGGGAERSMMALQLWGKVQASLSKMDSGLKDLTKRTQDMEGRLSAKMEDDSQSNQLEGGACLEIDN